MREEIGSRNVVVYPSDDATPVPRGYYVLLDPHQDSSLGSRFLALNYMEIHLVAIKICIAP